ncbi:MAG: rod shape-determining protein MreC [Myxococcota bacterium]
MLDLLEKHRRKLVALLLVLMPVAALGLRDEPGIGTEESPVVVEWTRGGTYATLAATHTSLAWIGEIWNSIAAGGSADEIERLEKEVARLQEEKSRLIGVLQENSRLRELVGFKQQHPEYELVPARVIGRDITPYFRVLKLRLKSSVKLEPRMPVVVADGVVGQIHEVQGHYADVIIVSDPRSRIDAVNQRNRASGIVQGLGHERDYLARIAYLSQKDEVRKGDVMVTGGMDRVFPKELIIGRVAEVARAKRGLFQEVKLEPSVDFSRLDEVFVITGAE